MKRCLRVCMPKFVPKTMSKTALVILAAGAEEIEAVTPVDVLRRAEVEVTLAGLDGADAVALSRNVVVKPDCSLQQVTDKLFDVVILPGGGPGSERLRQSGLVKKILLQQESNKGMVAAICAGTTALAVHGVYSGKKLTSYPAVQKYFEEKYEYMEERVVIDGELITSRGPGTCMEWSLAIVERLVGKEKVDEMKKAMLTNF